MAARPNARSNGRHQEREDARQPPPTAPTEATGDAMPPGQRIAYLEALVRTMQDQLADANARAAHAHTLARLNEQAANALEAENRQMKAKLSTAKPN